MKDSCPENITRRCFLENTAKLCFTIGLPSVFLDSVRQKLPLILALILNRHT